MSGLPRDVLKWLQALNLSTSVNNPHWDLRNGYVVGRLLKIYHPSIQTIFTDDNDLVKKKRSWEVIEKTLSDLGTNVPKRVLEGCMHGKVGASQTLLNILYTHFTQRGLILKQNQHADSTFSDIGYQATLPPYARNTTIASLRSNYPTTERKLNGEMQERKKSIDLIQRYKMHDELMRQIECKRYRHKATTRELALRLTPPPSHSPSSSSWHPNTVHNMADEVEWKEDSYNYSN